MPLDLATIEDSVKKTSRLIVSHQAHAVAHGAEIAAGAVSSAFSYLDASPISMCGKDVPVLRAGSLETAAYRESVTSRRRLVLLLAAKPNPSASLSRPGV